MNDQGKVGQEQPPFHRFPRADTELPVVKFVLDHIKHLFHDVFSTIIQEDVFSANGRIVGEEDGFAHPVHQPGDRLGPAAQPKMRFLASDLVETPAPTEDRLQVLFDLGLAPELFLLDLGFDLNQPAQEMIHLLSLPPLVMKKMRFNLALADRDLRADVEHRPPFEVEGRKRRLKVPKMSGQETRGDLGCKRQWNNKMQVVQGHPPKVGGAVESPVQDHRDLLDSPLLHQAQDILKRRDISDAPGINPVGEGKLGGLTDEDPQVDLGKIIPIPVITPFEFFDELRIRRQRGDIEEDPPQVSLAFHPGLEKPLSSIFLSPQLFHEPADALGVKIQARVHVRSLSPGSG